MYPIPSPFLFALLVVISGALAKQSPVCTLLTDTDKQVAGVGYHWKPLGTMHNTTDPSLHSKTKTSIYKGDTFASVKSQDGRKDFSITTFIPTNGSTSALVKFYIATDSIVDVKTGITTQGAFRIRYNLPGLTVENTFDGTEIDSVDYLMPSSDFCFGFSDWANFVSESIKSIEFFQLIKDL